MQIPCIAPPLPQEGRVGYDIDRCIILHLEYIACKILPVLSCVQYKNDVSYLDLFW